MGDILNIKQAAEILGISDVTLRRWLKSDDLSLHVPHWQSGPRGDYKFDKDDVIQWKESQKQGNLETEKANT